MPPQVWLVRRCLLAIYRQRGIGSQLLQEVIRNAALQCKPVVLRVLRVLRVKVRKQALYLKHRIAVVSETLSRLRMRHDSTDNLADTDLQAQSGSPNTWRTP